MILQAQTTWTKFNDVSVRTVKSTTQERLVFRHHESLHYKEKGKIKESEENLEVQLL